MTEHNHITRDIKAEGLCPACDEYHAKHPNLAKMGQFAEEHPEIEPISDALGLSRNSQVKRGEIGDELFHRIATQRAEQAASEMVGPVRFTGILGLGIRLFRSRQSKVSEE